MKRTFALVLSLVLLVTCIVGATLAWLNDETTEIENTFTMGKVDIDLTEEEKGPFKMTPGSATKKDPKVSVAATSEDCWVFVKITKEGNFDTYLTYEVATGWTLVEGTTNVYAREGKAGDEWSVLKDDQVVMLDTVEGFGNDAPTLTFKAYAIQKENLADAKTAWAALQG